MQLDDPDASHGYTLQSIKVSDDKKESQDGVEGIKSTGTAP